MERGRRSKRSRSASRRRDERVSIFDRPRKTRVGMQSAPMRAAMGPTPAVGRRGAVPAPRARHCVVSGARARLARLCRSRRVRRRQGVVHPSGLLQLAKLRAPKDQASARRLQRRQLARALPSASNRRDPERNSCAAWARGQSAAWLPTVVATKVPKNTARFHDRREGLETGVGTVSKKANSIWRPAPRSRGTRPPRL